MEAENPPMSEPSALLEALTREYARYSRSAGGLSAILGGSFGLVAFGLGTLAPPSAALTAVLLAFPVLWLALRRVITHRWYQARGRVTELASPTEHALQRRLTAGVTLVCAIVVAGLVVRDGDPTAWSHSEIAFAALVAALPFVAWWWLHTPLELVVAVLLVSQAALAVEGRADAAWGSASVLGIGAGLLVARGIGEHRRFRALDAELRQLRTRALGA
jgi:hypothetical protein